MKCICIGRNYGKHALELGNDLPDEPVVFLKPESALLPAGELIQLPAFSQDVHHEIEIVLKLARPARNVSREQALSLIQECTVGLDLTARDLQNELKRKGLPWEKAKAFDGSAVVGTFVSFSSDEGPLSLELIRNGKTVQSGVSSDMIFSFAEIISHTSAFFSLEQGDLIFTGTPEGVGPIASGDQLQGYLNQRLLLDIAVS